MRLRQMVRLAGGLALALGLAGCMDVDVVVKVKSMTEAQAVMTQTFSAQVYPKIKASAGTDADADGPNALCEHLNGGALTENADGSATCTIVTEGGFANFSVDNGADEIDFTTPGPGLVRVSVPSRELTDGAAPGTNATGAGSEMQQEMLTAFAGHFLTVTFGGGTITDTNMTLAADRRSASVKVPFTDLIDGTARLPDEIYAVVRLD